MIVTGLPADAGYDLYQTSDGTFVLPLWRGAEELGGSPVPVTISLAQPAIISEWDVVADKELQAPHRTTDLTVQLDASCRLVVDQALRIACGVVGEKTQRTGGSWSDGRSRSAPHWRPCPGCPGQLAKTAGVTATPRPFPRP